MNVKDLTLTFNLQLNFFHDKFMSHLKDFLIHHQLLQNLAMREQITKETEFYAMVDG